MTVLSFNCEKFNFVNSETQYLDEFSNIRKILSDNFALLECGL